MEKMRKREHDRQNKIEEEKSMPKSKKPISFNCVEDPWKMKRFQSVDGKVAQYVRQLIMIRYIDWWCECVATVAKQCELS